MNTDILFVIPKSEQATKAPEIPLGLLYISSSLIKAEYKPEIYDMTIGERNLLYLMTKIEKGKIDIIGISFGTDNRFSAFKVCKKIKQHFPNITIIAGGWHVNGAPIDTIKNIKDIDIIVQNEGEETTVELLENLKNNKSLKKVKGIYYRKKDKMVYTGRREFIKTLDTISWPARNIINLKEYNQVLPFDSLNTPSTSIITSRGCPHQCIYCSTSKHWGQMVRYRDILDVVDEIEDIVYRYKIKGIEIRDDTFTLNKKRLLAFCAEIKKRNLKIRWWCETRANTIDEEMASAMAEAGCYYMAMAIESANPKTLKTIQKAITIEQALKAVKTITKFGIKLKIFFMFGLPEEGKEEIKNTCNMIMDLQHKYKVQPIYSITTILPGTHLEVLAKEKGIIPQDFSWSKPFKNPPQKFNLYFAKHTPLFTEKNIPYKKLASLIRRYFLIWYIKHPIYFMKILWKNKKHIRKWIK